MRSVAFLLLFMAVGSLQLPWVSCELGSFHLDLGAVMDCHHEQGGSDEDGNHEAVDWPAVPAAGHANVALVAPAAQCCVRDRAPAVECASRCAPQARAAAPPSVAPARCAVLLL